MGWVPDEVVAAMRGSHQLGVFFRIGTDPALHWWMGFNDIPAGIDSVDEDGTVYLGGGQLLSIPELEVLVNGKADRVEFSLAGIDRETAAIIISQIPAVRGAEVTIGITTLDQYYQPMSAIIPMWSGIASHKSRIQPPVTGTDTPTVTLVLLVTAGDMTRARPARSLWSSAHQKAISPTDKFCDNTARLGRGVMPTWPRF